MTQTTGQGGGTPATETKALAQTAAPKDLQPLEQLRWYLEDEASGYRKRLEQMMGRRAPQFFSSIMSLANSSIKFKDVEPKSIIAAAVVAATLDLPIDRNMGFAWIIPYGKLAQFQIGYKGWVQLALRTGRYSGMNALAINAEAWQGWDEIGDPLIDWNAIDLSKPAVGYAFAWRLTTGFTKIVYWTKEAMQAHAKRYSKAYQYGLSNPTQRNAQDSPWFTDFDKMGLKTVISNSLRRWGIMSVEYQELQFAYERDQTAAIDIDATPIYPDNDRGGDVAERMQEQTAASATELGDKLRQEQGSQAGGGQAAGAATSKPEKKGSSRKAGGKTKKEPAAGGGAKSEAPAGEGGGEPAAGSAEASPAAGGAAQQPAAEEKTEAPAAEDTYPPFEGNAQAANVKEMPSAEAITEIYTLGKEAGVKPSREANRLYGINPDELSPKAIEHFTGYLKWLINRKPETSAEAES